MPFTIQRSPEVERLHAHTLSLRVSQKGYEEKERCDIFGTKQLKPRSFSKRRSGLVMGERVTGVVDTGD